MSVLIPRTMNIHRPRHSVVISLRRNNIVQLAPMSACLSASPLWNYVRYIYCLLTSFFTYVACAFPQHRSYRWFCITTTIQSNSCYHRKNRLCSDQMHRPLKVYETKKTIHLERYISESEHKTRGAKRCVSSQRAFANGLS